MTTWNWVVSSHRWARSAPFRWPSLIVWRSSPMMPTWPISYPGRKISWPTSKIRCMCPNMTPLCAIFMSGQRRLCARIASSSTTHWPISSVLNTNLSFCSQVVQSNYWLFAISCFYYYYHMFPVLPFILPSPSSRVVLCRCTYHFFFFDEMHFSLGISPFFNLLTARIWLSISSRYSHFSIETKATTMKCITQSH